MYGKHEWKNVEGCYPVVFGEDESGEWTAPDDHDRVIPVVIVKEVQQLFPRFWFVRVWIWIVGWFNIKVADERLFEAEIEFTSSGYYDPGKTSGLPENCYPPEGDDERLVDTVKVTCDNGSTKTTKKLSKETAQAFFDLFEEEIKEVELDTSNEPDDRYDHDLD